MKVRLSLLCATLSCSLLANQHGQLAELKKAILKSNLSKVEKFLPPDASLTDIATEISDAKGDLTKLVDEIADARDVKNQVGVDKWKKIRKISIGAGLVLIGGVKTIVETVYRVNDVEDSTDDSDNDSMEEQGFLTTNLLINLGLMGAGAREIYLGATGKAPNERVQDAIEIAQLLHSKLDDSPDPDQTF